MKTRLGDGAVLWTQAGSGSRVGSRRARKEPELWAHEPNHSWQGCRVRCQAGQCSLTVRPAGTHPRPWGLRGPAGSPGRHHAPAARAAAARGGAAPGGGARGEGWGLARGRGRGGQEGRGAGPVTTPAPIGGAASRGGRLGGSEAGPPPPPPFAPLPSPCRGLAAARARAVGGRAQGGLARGPARPNGRARPALRR